MPKHLTANASMQAKKNHQNHRRCNVYPHKNRAIRTFGMGFARQESRFFAEWPFQGALKNSRKDNYWTTPPDGKRPIGAMDRRAALGARGTGRDGGGSAHCDHCRNPRIRGGLGNGRKAVGEGGTDHHLEFNCQVGRTLRCPHREPVGLMGRQGGGGAEALRHERQRAPHGPGLDGGGDPVEGVPLRSGDGGGAAFARQTPAIDQRRSQLYARRWFSIHDLCKDQSNGKRQWSPVILQRLGGGMLLMCQLVWQGVPHFMSIGGMVRHRSRAHPPPPPLPAEGRRPGLRRDRRCGGEPLGGTRSRR